MDAPTCPEPGCGLPSQATYYTEVDRYQHELHAVCALGHIWATKWFAERSS